MAAAIILKIVMDIDSSVPFLRFEEERFYLDPHSGSFSKLPSIFERASLTLSIIIPAKDEEQRLPIMLDECIEFLEKKCADDSTFTYEIIVVDDFSSDNTTKLALSYSKRLGAEKLRVITLKKNRGKGGAVRLGFWAARGRRLLFADADGATRFSDFDKLNREIDEKTTTTTTPTNNFSIEEEKEAIVVGSRAHMEKESIVERSLFRTILMFGFHFLVWLFCVKTIRDTQCGFKLFTRSSVRILFWNLHIERWAFDVELLFLAEKLKIPISEVPVTWHEVAGSKLTPLAASCEMARDLFMIWFRYFTGIWTLDLKTPKSRVE